jgi:hypothetical protein
MVAGRRQIVEKLLNTRFVGDRLARIRRALISRPMHAAKSRTL